jgi:oxygen-dependent protoporphyrinogen oxidase
MLGRLDENFREAVIIGAGFSGLLAAYRLLQRGYQVSLYDAAQHAGGLIQTQQTEYGIAESAAHTIRSSPAMDALFQELNVEPVTARTNKKYILRGGKFRSFPLTISETADLAMRAAFNPAKSYYESLEDWALHHAGRGARNNIFHPMMQGIYAALPSELLPDLVFPKLIPPQGKTLLQHVLTNRRSNPYKSRVMAPRAGMAALTDALFKTILANSNAKVCLGQKISELPDVPNVILATPAAVTAQILNLNFSKSAQVLSDIRYAPMIAATVFLDKKMHAAPNGIGVLCAAHEPRQSLGILFNSATFEERVRDEITTASYTVMLGGTGAPEIMAFSNEALRGIVISELQAILKLSAAPLEIIIHRWPEAIPVYSPQLQAAHEVLRGDFCVAPGRMIFGNYTGQISLRGMVDTF